MSQKNLRFFIIPELFFHKGLKFQNYLYEYVIVHCTVKNLESTIL